MIKDKHGTEKLIKLILYNEVPKILLIFKKAK